MLKADPPQAENSDVTRIGISDKIYELEIYENRLE